MPRRWRKGRRAGRQVVRLADAYADVAASGLAGTGPSRPWQVIVLTDEAARHLYTTMTQDVAFSLHRAASAVDGGYTHEHALRRLVLVETYHCRHTAFARVSRIRAWPVRERRRLIEAANPDWTDLADAWDGTQERGGAEEQAPEDRTAQDQASERTQPTMRSASSAAA